MLLLNTPSYTNAPAPKHGRRKTQETKNILFLFLPKLGNFHLKVSLDFSCQRGAAASKPVTSFRYRKTGASLVSSVRFDIFGISLPPFPHIWRRETKEARRKKGRLFSFFPLWRKSKREERMGPKWKSVWIFLALDTPALLLYPPILLFCSGSKSWF